MTDINYFLQHQNHLIKFTHYRKHNPDNIGYLDEKLFKEITDYNDKLEAYYKSLKYITKKLRTEKEIYKCSKRF